MHPAATLLPSLFTLDASGLFPAHLLPVSDDFKVQNSNVSLCDCNPESRLFAMFIFALTKIMLTFEMSINGKP